MRRALIIAVGGVAALLAADTVLWSWAVGRVEAETALWISQRRVEGWTVTAGAAEREGWPFAAKVRLHGVALTAAPPTTPQPVVVESGEALVGVGFLRPRLLVVRLEGPQALRVGSLPALEYQTDRSDIRVPLTDDRLPPSIDIAIEVARLGLASGGELRIGHIDLHADLPSSALPGTTSVTLDAGPADLPPTAALAAIGRRIDRLQADAAVAPGSFELHEFHLTWGPLSLTAHASLHPDAARQPAGNGDVRLIGAAETLDALVSAGMVAPRAGLATKAVLALLQRPRPDGTAVVELPLTLADGTLQAGRFPIAKLPQFAW